MAIMSDRTQAFFLPNSSSAPPSRKYSAPIALCHTPISSLTHDHSYGRGSLLPMPPNYNEGSCWTLASVRCLSSSSLESRTRTLLVEVTKVSLRMDGRWAEEKPYILEKTWDEWVDFREQLISQYPAIECLLPKLSKGQGFLESIFTNSKRSQNTQSSNIKELKGFLSSLIGKCPKKVLNSDITHVFLQTEQMRTGAHQVEYTDDELPLRRGPPPTVDTPNGDDGAAISSHLQSFRFPGPQSAQSSAPPLMKPKASQTNLALRPLVLASEIDKPSPNGKISPHDRRRPTLDLMDVIDERPLPPALVPDPQSGLLRSGTIGRSLAPPTVRLTNKSRSPLRPNTAITRPAPVIAPKRPNTSDSRLPHEALLKPAMGANARAVCTPAAPKLPRRPSELLPGLSGEVDSPKFSRPHLREFKSMQDIRATVNNGKPTGRIGKGGWIDSTRNNSVPVVGESAQMVLQVRSPTTFRHRHRRTPSDSSSSFGSSQLSPVSSVLSSPTVTPSTSNNSISKVIPLSQVQSNSACRLSVDSPASHPAIAPERETSKVTVRHHVPPAPFYAIPPRVAHPTTILPNKRAATFVQSQQRPHTSAGNANGLKPSSLALKVVHLESKTNIILAIQKGLFSLPQIKSKIQNKLKMAADIELDPEWKIQLTMIDQEEFVRRGKIADEEGVEQVEDDGLKLLELINGPSNDSQIKKITLRIH
ncbi:hypothetical protein PCANC_20779 [Puccinia coronata f. sp. avenae]|uniref:PX domain-containing protein n=1 Tax=Puccinia coronata f. sp. avenae TaxID=200324 RepID=A0A2N5TRF5_9BASI|nr:hypothetical protein PCANC_20779 [Puccinia coronata f. sp. avenae]